MRKYSLFISEPAGMDIGVMGFFEVLLPEYLPEGFEFFLKPWQNKDTDQDVTFCVRVTKVEFTIRGETSYCSINNAHTAVLVEPVLAKTNATLEEWRKFAETADT